MISHKHKFIFVHIGKTGGSSIERSIDPDIRLDSNPLAISSGNTEFEEKHWAIEKYQREYKKYFNSYFKFAFVRNPWDREVSRWKWFTLVLDRNNSFKEHLETMTMNVYSDWLGKNGQYLTDFIGRFENLQGDFNIVCDKIGIPRQELPHYNKTDHKHYTEYYDDETREIVAKRYAKDIEYFGYEYKRE